MSGFIGRAIGWLRERMREDNTRAGLNGLVVVGTSLVVFALVAYGLPVEAWFTGAEEWIGRATVLAAKVGVLVNALAAIPNLRAVVTPEVPSSPGVVAGAEGAVGDITADQIVAMRERLGLPPSATNIALDALLRGVGR